MASKNKKTTSPFAYKIRNNKVVLPSLEGNSGNSEWEAAQLAERVKEDAAKRVFDVLVEPLPKVEFSDPIQMAEFWAHVNAQKTKVDAAIRENLNHETIGYFMKMVVTNAVSHRQSTAKRKGHAEDYAIKAAVFQWLDAREGPFKGAEKAGMAITRHHPIAHRTAVGYYKEWKKLQSTGRV